MKGIKLQPGISESLLFQCGLDFRCYGIALFQCGFGPRISPQYRITEVKLLLFKINFVHSVSDTDTTVLLYTDVDPDHASHKSSSSVLGP
jgi:hypothetical protein